MYLGCGGFQIPAEEGVAQEQPHHGVGGSTSKDLIALFGQDLDQNESFDIAHRGVATGIPKVIGGLGGGTGFADWMSGGAAMREPGLAKEVPGQVADRTDVVPYVVRESGRQGLVFEGEVGADEFGEHEDTFFLVVEPGLRDLGSNPLFLDPEKLGDFLGRIGGGSGRQGRDVQLFGKNEE